MIRSAASSSISSCSTSRTASRTRSVTSTERVQLLGQGRLWQGHRRATPVNIVCGYHSRGGSCTYRRSEAPTHCSSLVAVLRRGPVQRSDRRSFECGRCCLGRMRYVRSRRRSTFLRRRSRTTLPRSTASSGYPRDGASKTSLKQTPVRSLTSGCQGAGDFPRHSSAERIASLALLVTEGKASETAYACGERTACALSSPGPCPPTCCRRRSSSRRLACRHRPARRDAGSTAPARHRHTSERSPPRCAGIGSSWNGTPSRRTARD